MKTVVLELGKATLCLGDIFGVTPRHVLDLKIEYGLFAQYAQTFHVSYKLPRKRKRDAYIVYAGRLLVVLKGHAQLAPIDPFTTTRDGRVTRFGSYDPRYTQEFRDGLKAYLQGHPDDLAFDAWTPEYAWALEGSPAASSAGGVVNERS